MKILINVCEAKFYESSNLYLAMVLQNDQVVEILSEEGKKVYLIPKELFLKSIESSEEFLPFYE